MCRSTLIFISRYYGHVICVTHHRMASLVYQLPLIFSWRIICYTAKFKAPCLRSVLVQSFFCLKLRVACFKVICNNRISFGWNHHFKLLTSSDWIVLFSEICEHYVSCDFILEAYWFYNVFLLFLNPAWYYTTYCSAATSNLRFPTTL